MELTHGRLKAALISGKIPVNDETVATFNAGLSAIGRGYHIEKVVSKKPKTADLTRNLLQLYKAFCTIIEISDADQNDLRQIELMLSDLWRGHQVLGFVEDLRPLCIHLELVLAVIAQNTERRERRQNPETWLLLAVHDLFATITGNPEPGIAGPLHRFTKRCAALIDSRIRVPESENSFQKRLTAALARRTGKISVMPRAVFPGKL
jgi:hypothetical protein